MKINQDQLWIGEEDLKRSPDYLRDAQGESSLPSAGSSEPLSTQSNRRDFLKYLGFGIGAATLASCEIPIKRAIPYVVKPDSIVPGVATYYASTFVNGGDVMPILVKTREGRPIKIEGNSLSTISRGGTSARAQASVLDLYDINRLREPMTKAQGGDKPWQASSWEDLDNAVITALKSNGAAVLLTHSIVSPTAMRLISDLQAKYPSLKHVQYDAISNAGLLQANEETFGEAVIPDYHFDKADIVLSFGADFLGTWLASEEYIGDFAERRKIRDLKKHNMSRLYMVETGMSITGGNADHRLPIKPSLQGAALAYVYNKICGGGAPEGGLSGDQKKVLDEAIRDLRNAQGKSIVVAGSNNKAEQVLVNAINHALGNYGKTMTFERAATHKKGQDKDWLATLTDIKAGRVNTLITFGCNPAYDNPEASEFVEASAKINTKIALSYKMDETTLLADYVAPLHHNLESWGDTEAKKGSYSTIQPCISPIFNTRQWEESLLVWGEMTGTYEDYLKANWKENIFPSQSQFSNFDRFWELTLQDGVFEGQPGQSLSYQNVAGGYEGRISRPTNSDLEINFIEKVGMGDGSYANNPWLQELPDPITRCVWNNYLAVPIGFDGDIRFEAFGGVEKDGELVEIAIGGNAIETAAIKQFGQAKNTFSVALGYGRTAGGACAKGTGTNYYPYLERDGDGNLKYFTNSIEWKGTSGKKEDRFACVQYHHTMGVEGTDAASGKRINADEQAIASVGVKGYQGSLTDRTIIRRANADELETFAHDLQHERHHHQHLNEQTLYPGHEDLFGQGHHWGMHIDLNACIGCGSCAVACMAENNVPVVGKKEVSRHHEMTWLRIDRYYYGDVDNPSIVYQPMMCQHCDNAPCENVCPVNATNHSSEGVNQMAYNRCVGTRYCANNCPYKVRRFNWLDYTTADTWPDNEPVLVEGGDLKFGSDDLTRMVLNPDVTVRSRGVIEKCSFCTQRIQEGKLTAKREGRRLLDSDVKTACQTACPTGAITFGDMNNPKGELSTKLRNPLNYIVLEEVNVQSSVQYTARISNKSKNLDV